jgi:hypothetical protein
MKRHLHTIVTCSLLLAVSCKKPDETPAPSAVTFCGVSPNYLRVDSKAYFPDPPLVDTINQTLNSVSLSNGVQLRFQFKSLPTKDGSYKLTGIKPLDSGEVWVQATIPLRLPIVDSSDYIRVSSTTVGNVSARVMVINGGIFIDIPEAAFVKMPSPTDTVMVAAGLAGRLF